MARNRNRRDAAAVDPTTGMLPRMWTAKIGSGYAGPAVAGGRVLSPTGSLIRTLERALCFDAETGKELWKHEYRARYTISYPLGPRATPAVDGDRVLHAGAIGKSVLFGCCHGQRYLAEKSTDRFWHRAAAMGHGRRTASGWRPADCIGGRHPTRWLSVSIRRPGLSGGAHSMGQEPGYCAGDLEFGGRRQLIIWHPAAVVGLDPAMGKYSGRRR